ncbi:glycosyltransferase family 4 protein [Halobacillus faecis]|uniref:Glycosyl transferase family 1 domain-containing protein n=1 Tax=Halobacillus faecis TaxID=360184 RepID=A0A511WRQ6_9BACI|nr:glycosyltransferase family 4 protein [Halobacillus faecis]GEN53834.1 hypothetical protein HFA01_20960 [Halobacillus faecis]
MIPKLRTKEFNQRLQRLPFAQKQVLSQKGEIPKKIHIVYAMTHVAICGGVKVIFEHANRLHKAGVKVTLVSHFEQPSWFPVEAEYIQVPFDLELAKGIPDCDLIVATYWDHVQACIDTGLAPVVYFEQGDFHLYDYETMNPTLKNFIHKQFEIVPYIYTVSNHTSKLISEIYGREAQVFPNAVDEEIFSVKGEKVIGKRPYVLMVGGESATFKGIPNIIEAYRKIKKEMDIDLYWITPEHPSEKMKSLVTKVFVSPSQETIGNLYRGAALYVCGSYYESFSLPPLEAMACGCAVVTTDNRGTLEYAVHKKNAVICKMKDVEDMAEKMEEVLSNQQLKEELIANGVQTASEYLWDRIVQGIHAFYKQIASYGIEREQDLKENWDISVRPENFVKSGDYEKFKKLLNITDSGIVKVPVLYEVDGKAPNIARWEVAACRKNGGRNLTDHCYCPVTPFNRLQLYNSPGYRPFLLNDYEKALLEFQSLSGHADGLEKAVADRWVILTLMRLQRKQEAKKRLIDLQRIYPHYTDFHLLEMLIVEEKHVKRSKNETINVLGDATSYPEFFFDVQKHETK